MSSGVEELDSSIRMVLMTAPGERLMRPNFGCRIWELMFEPINANTLGLMAVAVREALLARALSETSGSTLLTGAEGAA